MQDVLGEEREIGSATPEIEWYGSYKGHWISFLLQIQGHTGARGKPPEESHHTRRNICQESRMAIAVAKPCYCLNYAQYQSFVRSCEHLFCTRLCTTYRKDFHKILYRIALLEEIPSTCLVSLRRGFRSIGYYYVLGWVQNLFVGWTTYVPRRFACKMRTRNIEKQSKRQGRLFMLCEVFGGFGGAHVFSNDRR